MRLGPIWIRGDIKGSKLNDEASSGMKRLAGPIGSHTLLAKTTHFSRYVLSRFSAISTRAMTLAAVLQRCVRWLSLRLFEHNGVKKEITESKEREGEGEKIEMDRG